MRGHGWKCSSAAAEDPGCQHHMMAIKSSGSRDVECGASRSVADKLCVLLRAELEKQLKPLGGVQNCN